MLISTSDININSKLDKALFNCQPDKNSLWFFERIPKLNKEELKKLNKMDYITLSVYILNKLLNEKEEVIPYNDLKEIIKNAYNFPIKIKSINDSLHFLELTHGETVTFKDYGARILAQLILYFKKDKSSKLTILIATSGDTGSAVAHAFKGIKNIECHILFPKDKISVIQKKQMTTIGDNIHCYETLNDFDRCQSWVKRAFDDKDLNKFVNLTSANSINIGRLIGQITYYFYVYSKTYNREKQFIISIPSGNLGNLTGAIIAYKMGLPITKIIASCNKNGQLKNYLKNGKINKMSSETTVSSAMDICNPSNLKRIIYLLGDDLSILESYNISDSETMILIKKIYTLYNYIVCPHTAVGYGGLSKYLNDKNIIKIVVSTSNPVKFNNIIQKCLCINTPIPKQLEGCLDKQSNYLTILDSYEIWKAKFIYIVQKFKNITLIGMPGCGKSTIAKLLEKNYKYSLIDLDTKIEQKKNMKLIEIINKYGNERFTEIEKETYYSIEMHKQKNIILSPGGSIIYKNKVMKDIKKNSFVIYLYVDFEELQNRLGDYKKRGIIFKKNQTLKNLYDLRHPIYKSYSDYMINTTGLSLENTIKLFNL